MEYNLDTHFPSSPSRPPKHVLYFRDPSRGVRAVHGFCSLPAAKGFLDEVLQHLPQVKPKWENSTTIDLDGVLSVESHTMEDIMEVERGLRMPYPYTAFAAGIAGREPSRFVQEEHAEHQPKERRRRSQEAPETVKSKSTEDGQVTAGDLASELGMSPGKVRSILRSKGVSKPYSWVPGKDLDDIRALIKEAQ